MNNHHTLLVPIEPLSSAFDLPQYATNGSAGMDLRAHIDGTIILGAGSRQLVPCGFRLALPEGFEAQIRPRSGLALKYGITVLNAPGTIDSDYRGEIGVILWNSSDQDFTLKRGERIAQMVVAPVISVCWQVETLDDDARRTIRGQGGFGSTGV